MQGAEKGVWTGRASLPGHTIRVQGRPDSPNEPVYAGLLQPRWGMEDVEKSFLKAAKHAFFRVEIGDQVPDVS